MRSVWDPDDHYADYYFERQAQTFPDVRLVRRSTSSAEVAMGIELKGWYLLAKENMPSLRYKVTPAACAELDLVVVVPWHLSNVLSGVPVAVSPWVESARYAALYRNYHWSHLRNTEANPSIEMPENAAPYPAASDQISDNPVYDGGGNFGRIARVEPLMGEFISSALKTPVAGIPARDWVVFFKTYVETRDPEAISDSLKARYAKTVGAMPSEDAIQLQDLLDDLVRLLAGP